MTSQEAYAALLAHQKMLSALGGVSGLIGWDQEAMMPQKGAEARAEQSGAMASVLHEKSTDPKIADWLDAIEPSNLDAVGQANMRLVRRSYERAVRVPGDLAADLSRTTSRAQHIWAEARANKDFAAFAPALKDVLQLTRDKAHHLKADGESVYDALLADYEPETSSAEIAATFDRLRAGLTELRSRILEKNAAGPELSGHFPSAAQLKLSHEAAGLFGYDFEAGRIDLVTHPFCSGTRGDVRMTTRVDEADPFNCLYSTIHETGHAIYEQGLNPETVWQPAGTSVSMGVHESQSRLCENQIGRSEAFTGWLYGRMVSEFGDFNITSARDFYRAVNRVTPGFIRTEADEIHYNIHIMMRFDLERALIAGDLEVSDLEAAWNDRFKADFGVDVPDPSQGVLQDVHWSFGLFGYFPTYTLGNLYAGCLYEVMRKDFPDLDQRVASVDLMPIREWLREKIHTSGSVLGPRETIAQAIGGEPTEKPLLDYLNAKFGDLYGL